MVGCLNSKLIQYCYSEKFKAPTELFPKIRIGQTKMLPIPIPSKEQENEVVNIVEAILKNKGMNEDTSLLEKKLDFIVYQLYGLTDEEIAIVEGNNE